MRVRCLAQEHNTMSQTGLKPGLLDPACGHPPPIDATGIIVSNKINAQIRTTTCIGEQDIAIIVTQMIAIAKE